MKKVVIFCAALSMSNVCFSNAPAKWYDTVSVKYIYSGQVGNRVAVGVEGVIDYGDCPQGEFVLEPSSPYFNSMFTMIMTAYTTGKKLSLFTDGTCAGHGVILKDVRMN